MRRALSLAVLALSAHLCAAPPQPVPAADEPPDVVVVHFNDFHGQIQPRSVVARPGAAPVQRGGFAALEAVVAARRAAHGERVWVTNGGDWFQGTPEGNEDVGASVMATLERLDLTASVIGNHEYDFGEGALIELVEGLRHPVLGANVVEVDAPRLRPYVRPYVVRKVAPSAGDSPAQRVAIVGLITAETPYVSTGPFGAAAFGDEVETLAALWPALRRDAEHVVLLTHCGVDRDRALAQRFPDVGLILGGHSHTELRRPVREGRTVIAQSGSSALAVTELELRVRPGRLEVLSFAFRDLDAAEPLPDTARFLAERFAHIGPKWDVPIGEVRGAPDSRLGPGSTPAGSFLAAIIREEGHAEVGLMNKGGIRATLAMGAVTRRDVFALVPFDNVVVSFEMDGATLRDVLGQGLAKGKRPLEVDGAAYTYVVEEGERRIAEVTVAGTPLREASTYRVATNSFLAAGGDGIDAFRRAREVDRGRLFLRELVVSRLQERGAIELPGDPRIQAQTR